jgi:hypothetical protein
MALRLMASVVVSLAALVGVNAGPSTTSAAVPPAPGATGARALPSMFYLEKNIGQAPGEVRYIAHTGGELVYLTARGEMISAAGRSLLRLAPAGGAIHPQLAAGSKLPGPLNYFIGNNPKLWHTNVPTYGQVTYRDVYPGIDLTFHGQGTRLEYNWVVRPGADPHRIRLAVSGAGEPLVDPRGALRFGDLPVLQSRPTLYQPGLTGRQLVPGGYALGGRDTVGFRVGRYDRSRTLVIDPVIMFAELLGGSGADFPYAVKVDAKGNIYVAGRTDSSDLPVRNAYQRSSRGSSDMFVLKLNPNGALLYGTYIGGSNSEEARSLAVDRAGRAYVAGATTSADFPLKPQAKFPGRQAGAIVSLSPGGNSLNYSMIFGDGGLDYAFAIAVDRQGDAYVPVRVGPGEKLAVLKVDPTGPSGPGTTTVSIGGSGPDTASGIAVAANGNVVVVGNTDSPDFYTYRAIQAAPGGKDDAFVTELDASLNHVLFSTYLGGSADDDASAVAVDGSNNIYVAGYTASSNFPYKVTFDVLEGSESPFVTKFSSDGAVLYSSIIGTPHTSQATALVVSKQGFATIGGFTAGSWLVMDHPLKGQAAFRGPTDGFLATLGGAGKQILFSSYLGGSGNDTVLGLAIGGSGNRFAVGYTTSRDFPRTRGQRFNPSGHDDGFLVKIGNHR